MKVADDIRQGINALVPGTYPELQGEIARLKQQLRISRDSDRMCGEMLELATADTAMWRAAYYKAVGEADPCPRPVFKRSTK